MSGSNAFEMLMRNASKSPAAKRKSGSSSAHTGGNNSNSSSSSSKRSKSSPATQKATASSSNCSAPTTHQQASAPQAAPAQPLQHKDAVAAFKALFSGQRRVQQQKFKYLLVYDLEATTNQARTLHPVEIIELACVIVDTSNSGTITASFQAFVKPTEHPVLDPFCIQLCGIQQDQVDRAQPLQVVLQEHHEWLQQQGMFKPEVTFVPVTWTSWDLKVALCTECGWRRIQRPDYLCRWVDLKKCFTARYKRSGNLKACVEAAGLTWRGWHHSGIDDAKNTANLAVQLMKQGAVFEVTETSENLPVQQPSSRITAANSSPNDSSQRRHATAAAPAAAVAPSVATAAAAAAVSDGSTPATPAAGFGSPGSKEGGRISMQDLAASRGISGIFNSYGKWTGLCFCQVKAHFRTTKKPGVNSGRQFYSCGNWRIAQQSKACSFFMWESDVPSGSILPT